MLNIGDRFKRYGGKVAKGLLQEMIPRMAAGLIVDKFTEWHVDLAKITGYIQNNSSLWAELTDENKRQLAYAARQAGSLDFITRDFFIAAIQEEFPAIASLFLKWGMAAQWLDRQIIELKGGVNSINIDNSHKNSK
jgi:hypothetical protein